MRKPRVVIAGQIPPPYGGQNIIVQKAVAQFAAAPECDAVHLPFQFTSDFQQARKAGAGKLFELLKIIGRLLRIRARGPIDLLVYPSGGPQTVPLIRDLLLLPWMLLCARKVVLHFHAAGIADRFRARPGGMLRLALGALYSRAAGAIVMADVNRSDPEFFGIKPVLVRPHRIPDEFDETLLAIRRADRLQLLYVGHLHPDKGTDALLRAFASLRRRFPELTLELAGEPLPPWSRKELEKLANGLGIASAVTFPGVLIGSAKAEAFARANLFVFPSVALYESFGLVLVEAMMWRLPIVATRWRGNAEVLTSGFGGILISPAPLHEHVERAVLEAIDQRKSWRDWGETNRQIFEQMYRETANDRWFSDAVLSRFVGT